MATFKSYPKASDTPSRRSRKGARNSVYAYNYKLGKKLRKERRLAKAGADE